MICREWRERDLVKGPPSTQIPARSMDLRRCSRSTLSSRQTVKDCSESFGMLQSNERPRQWYLRWFRRTVIPIDARMAVSTLESLSDCAALVVLVVANRKRRAYKISKADTRGTVVFF